MATPPSLKNNPSTPAPSLNLGENTTKPRPSLSVNQPVAIKDLMGEIWTLDSAMGRMLENTARENGVRPEYVTQQEWDAASKAQQPAVQTIKGPDGKDIKVETDFNIVNKQQSANPTSDTSGFYQQGLVPVKQMQQNIISFSKEISNHNIHFAPNRNHSNDPKQNELSGSDPFMNFLVNTYVNSAKTKGQQLAATNVRQPGHTGNAKANDNFKGVLDSITRIGLQGGQQPDGIWGERTHNALQQIYALAYAFMQIIHDMNLQISGYTDADLSELYNLISTPLEQLKINDKVSRAPFISKNINKLRGLYDTFREKILNNPEYSAHISQSKPLFVWQGQQPTANPLSGQEQALYEKHKVTPIDININGRKTFIMPHHLSNMSSFIEYLKTNGNNIGITSEELSSINQGDKTTVSKFLTAVVNELQGGQS